MSLPCSLESERAVLGAVLLTGNLPEEITAAHFSLDSNRLIYRALSELHEDGIGVDSGVLAEHLGSRKQLAAVGGIAYIASLTDSAAIQVESHCRIIREKAQLRGIVSAAQRAIDRAEAQNEKPNDILADFESASVAIASDAHVKERDIFLDVSKFVRQYQTEIEWRVDGVIEVGTSGIMVALPKAGKSMAAVGLAVSLASGAPWLDFAVRRARVALVSREDYAATTAHRIRRYVTGTGIAESDLKDNLWISSRAQVKGLLLDSPADLRMLINNLKRRQTEFLILDVLNVLHSKDENDNSEMRQVLKCVDHIRGEVGCQVLVIHHAKKQWDEGQTLSEAARGSSAIGGFAEFLIGIRLVDEETQTRQMKFETKAAEPQRPIYWKITDQNSQGGIVLERTEWTPTKGSKRQMSM